MKGGKKVGQYHSWDHKESEKSQEMKAIQFSLEALIKVSLRLRETCMPVDSSDTL